MNVLAVAGIAVLGGVGAVSRFLIDGAVAERSSRAFPLGTFAVNMSAAFLLGLLTGVTTDDQLLRLVATGLLGSYSTFSTWMLESQRLGEDGELGLALVNFAISLAGGIGLVWLGMQLGGAV